MKIKFSKIEVDAMPRDYIVWSTGYTKYPVETLLEFKKRINEVLPSARVSIDDNDSLYRGRHDMGASRVLFDNKVDEATFIMYINSWEF